MLSTTPSDARRRPEQTAGLQRIHHPLREPQQPGDWTRRLVCALLIGLAGLATAQDDPPPTMFSDELIDTIGEEQVNARIADLEARTDLDQKVRDQARALWEQVLVQLGQAEQFRAMAADWEAARTSAPETLVDIQAQLALPPAPPEEVPVGSDLTWLEAQLARARSQLASEQKAMADLASERQTRSDRRAIIPVTLSDTRERLDASDDAEAAASGEALVIVEARAALALITRRALEHRITALDQEVLSYDARAQLLRTREDLATFRVSEAAAALQIWQDRVNERRRRNVAVAEAEANQTRDASSDGHPLLSELATANATLAARRTELTALLESSAALLEEIKAAAQKLASQRSLVQQRVDRVGFTSAIAVLLQRHRNELPDAREHRQHLRELRTQTAAVQLEELDIQDERARLASLTVAVEDMTKDLGLEPRDLEDLQHAARSLLESRRELVDGLLDDVDVYLDRSVDLAIEEQGLTTDADSYRIFIAENLLWIRSTHTVRFDDLLASGETINWLFDVSRWEGLLSSAARDVKTHTLQVTLVALGLLSLLLLNRISNRRLGVLGESASQQRILPLRTMVGCLIYSVVKVATIPLALTLLGWWMVTMSGNSLGLSLGQALDDIGNTVIPFLWVLTLCQRRGMGEAVFNWPAPAIRATRRHVKFMLTIIAPCMLLVFTLTSLGDEIQNRSLGRLALIVALLTLSIGTRSLFRTNSPVTKTLAGSRAAGGWPRRLRLLWRFLAFTSPLAIALAVAVGFQYAGVELGPRLFYTWSLALSFFVLHRWILRWLAMQKRQLRIEQALRRRQEEADAAEAAGRGGVPEERPSDPVVLETAAEPEVDIASVDAQVHQLVNALLLIALLIGVGITWYDVLPALGALDRVALWNANEMVTSADGVMTPTTVVISLADLLLAFAVAGMTFLASKNLPGLLEISLLRRLPLEPGGGYAITTICRYVITIVGIVLSFGLIGISWNQVQFLAAAISVGLGFGLQEIFANFVSGLMILFERPVRVGDIVSVGGVDGIVTRIRIRATTIRDWDRRELLVPNKEFITAQLINWTLSDPVTRIIVPVGIAYGSDTKLATKTLMEVARKQPLVLENPEPTVVFRKFGDSTLNFDLRLFLADRESWPVVTHAVNTEIDRLFKERGIEIAFPQRDLHIKTFGADVEKALRASRGKADDGAASS